MPVRRGKGLTTSKAAPSSLAFEGVNRSSQSKSPSTGGKQATTGDDDENEDSDVSVPDYPAASDDDDDARSSQRDGDSSGDDGRRGSSKQDARTGRGQQGKVVSKKEKKLGGSHSVGESLASKRKLASMYLLLPFSCCSWSSFVFLLVHQVIFRPPQSESMTMKEPKRQKIKDDSDTVRQALTLQAQEWQRDNKFDIKGGVMAKDLFSTKEDTAGLQRPFNNTHAELVKEGIFSSKAPLERDVVMIAIDKNDLKQGEKTAKCFTFRGADDPNPTPFVVIKGQHTAWAYAQLAVLYPTEERWRGPFPVSAVLYDSTSDAETAIVTMAGKLNNKKNEAVRKETLVDSVSRARQKAVSKCLKRGVVFNSAADLTNEEVTTIKSQCFEQVDTSDRWRIAGLPQEIYDLAMPLFKGEAVDDRRKKTIKAPMSGSHFAHIAHIDTPILKTFVTQLVKGIWSGQAFLDKCKQFKKAMILRIAIVKYLIAVGKIKKADIEDKTFLMDDTKSKKAVNNPTGGLNFEWDKLIVVYPQLEDVVRANIKGDFKIDLFTDLQLTPAMQISVDHVTDKKSNVSSKAPGDVKVRFVASLFPFFWVPRRLRK